MKRLFCDTLYFTSKYDKNFILVYVEFGTTSTDTVTLTNTWATGGLTTAKNYNILARQIPCTATYKYIVI